MALILLDANLLIYSVHKGDPNHAKAQKWMEDLFESENWIGIPWVSAWGFLRISTNSRLFTHPLSQERAFEYLDVWLSCLNVTVPEPGSRHRELLRKVVRQAQATGPRLTDAVLAALAMEHGATIASADLDFARFKELSWINPLSGD